MALKFFSKIQLCMGLTLLEVLFAANYCSAVGDSCNEMSNSKTIETCEMFKPEEFTKDSTSIIYGEAQGRFGNQLLGYIVLLQVCIGVPPQLVHTAWCSLIVSAWTPARSPNVYWQRMPAILAQVFHPRVRDDEGAERDLLQPEGHEVPSLQRTFQRPLDNREVKKRVSDLVLPTQRQKRIGRYRIEDSSSKHKEAIPTYRQKWAIF